MKNTTIMINLLYGILLNAQIIACSEAAALAPTSMADTRASDLIAQCDGLKNRNDYGGIISAISVKGYHKGGKIVPSAFYGITPASKAQIICHLIVAINTVGNDPAKVKQIMKDAGYYNGKDKFLPAFLVLPANEKAAMCGNLIYALVKTGSPKDAVSLAQSAGYWNGMVAAIPVLDSIKNADYKAELVNNLACALMDTGHDPKLVLENLMKPLLYYTGGPLTPSGFKDDGLSAKNKAALCITMAVALNRIKNPIMVLHMMRSAGYWNGRGTFSQKDLLDIPYTLRVELVNQFATALNTPGYSQFVPMLERAAVV